MSGNQNTIVALSTPFGEGAIGVIRLSGEKAMDIVVKATSETSLSDSPGYRAHFVKVMDEDGNVIDECIATLFKGPKSYTGEDVVEISCHGSAFIIQSILSRCIELGATPAQPGEFTQRAFLNGKMDLSQAEAVADLIASSSASQHRIAMNQMRGGVSDEIQELRSKLIEFASLIELENDFGEEDVEFADRTQLIATVKETKKRVHELLATFELGQAIKSGISVAIVGRPNVGKSTLLNALLKEEKAIVSDIPGTTRDVIEDTIQIDGVLFRFVDTAGLRDTTDTVEKLGIERSYQQLRKADIVIYVDEITEHAETHVERYHKLPLSRAQNTIIILNKIDSFHTCHSYDVEEAVSTLLNRIPVIALSALNKTHIDRLKTELIHLAGLDQLNDESVIISNIRHAHALRQTSESLDQVLDGLASGISSDLIAIDIRHAQHYLGEIAGSISTEDLLESIFMNFCIGK